MKFKNGKIFLASLMTGTLLLGGCASQKTSDAAETQAASAGAENTIMLSGSTASCSNANVKIEGSTIKITGAGTYELTGTLDDGMVIVDAGDEDDVELVLNNASITSGTSAAIYIANCDDAAITLASGSENALSNGGSFEAIDEKNIDGAIYARKDLTLSGDGSLNVTSPAGHGIVAKDDLTVEGGTYTITAASHGVTGKDALVLNGGAFTITAGEDGLHAKNSDDAALGNLTIRGGEYTITAGDDGVHASGNTVIEAGTVTILESSEGIEGQTVTISGGAIRVTASDDGLNAAGGSDSSAAGDFGGSPFDSDASAEILIEGGTLYVNAGGDGIDSNGTITMTGGQVFVSGPTNSGNGALDYGISATVTGGTIVAAGASGMAENFTAAEGQGVMLVSTGAQQAGSAIQLADASGNVLVTWQPEKAYECVVISTPDVQQGGTYTLTAGSSTQTVEMTGAVYGGGMGMGGMGQMGGMGGQPGQMGGGRPGGGMGRP